MKNLFLLLFFIPVAVAVHAQAKGGNSIIGTVMNAVAKTPLEYATVSLFNKDGVNPINGTTTDNTGSFILADIPAGTYTLVIENIGYAAYTKKELLLNKKDAIIDLKNIFLSPNKTLMQEVTVTSKTKLVENKIDKIVFNAEKDVSSQGGVATDVLKKVPQVSVDAEGNIQLAGSSGIRFLINGKPSSAFGSNIADVLQSIPASQIKSIEVITNPGAKYDAQGLGGIINIILKKNNTKGYNGNISLTAGTRNENAAFNFNVRNNDFGMNAFFSGNKRLPSTSTNNNYRETTDSSIISTLLQNNSRRFDRQGYQSGVGFDWTFKKYNSLSGSIAYYYFGFNGNGSTSQVLQPDKGGSIPDILSTVNAGNQYRYHSIDASLNYKRTFAKEDQELEAAISINPGSNKGITNSEQFASPQDSLYYGTKGYNPSSTKETVLSLDYTHPLPNDIKLGIGSKATFYNVESNGNISSYQPVSHSYLPDDFLSNQLTYKQKVYAAYAELSFPVAKLFDAKIGGRYERTLINAYYSNAGQQINVPGYNTFVPSVFLSKKIGEKQTIKLSFSKRINRPDYEDLNPFVNTADPKNLETGNPYLKPELGYRYELGYSRDLGKTGSLMINLFHRINQNDIQPYLVYYPTYNVGDSVYTNVSVTAQQNIGRENNSGLNLFADLHLTAKLNIRGNVFMFYRHTINAIDRGLNSNSYNIRFNINASYQFTNSLLAEFFGNFNGPRNEAQGKYPAFISYTTAIRKQFWQKKGSIALTATNPFSENFTQKTILTGTNFKLNSERTFPFRSIGINFTWKFGKLEFKKSNEESGDNNLNQPAQ
jgi:outer membrane receptor protein involved in Fe transport